MFAQNVYVNKRTGKPADDNLCEVNQADGNSALIHNVARQYKERNGQQGENGDSLEKLLGCGGDGCRTVKKLHNGDHGGCCQCHGNGHS